MASLLEGTSLNPAIVIVPGHAFLGWETWRNNGDWRYLETTMLGSHSFDDACIQGDKTALTWQAHDQRGKMFRRWSLRDVRAMGITPLEQASTGSIADCQDDQRGRRVSEGKKDRDLHESAPYYPRIPPSHQAAR